MITSAYIEDDDPQVDGRRAITEVQVDDAAGPLRFYWLAEPDADVEAIVAMRTAQLDAASDG